MVYESMGYVWYERSTDNGITWAIMNNGKPLSASKAKNPAIDYYNNNTVGIVYQEEYIDIYSDDTYKIRFALLYDDGTIWFVPSKLDTKLSNS